MKLRIALAACAAAGAAWCAAADGDIYVGGTFTANAERALDILGESYTVVDAYPDPGGYGPGDILVLGYDGGTGPFPDYTAFLNSGGDIILAGGSSLDQYRAWASLYFNITDTGAGWHTDGDYHETTAHIANQYMPDDYTFEDSSMTFHMLGFDPGPDTTLLATNDEDVSIHAFREYANGGSFNYMALDINGPYGTDGDINNFVVPWLRGGLEAAKVPAPGALALLGVAGLVARRRRR